MYFFNLEETKECKFCILLCAVLPSWDTFTGKNMPIGVGRFRILGDQGLEYWRWGEGQGGQIPSRHMTSY